MSARSARGMTLLELMVALTVSLVSVAAAMTLLIQQQRAYTVTAAERAQQEAGRMALQELAARLKLAGYGVDPNLAFDFGQTDVAPRTDLRAPASAVRLSSYACGTAITCRDRTTGSDEVVFHARNPSFRRVASAVSSSSITLVGELAAPLYPGQILQVSCLGGARVRAYVTVGATVAAAASPDPTKTVTIALAGGQQAGGLEVFPRENAELADGCFSLTAAGSQPIVTLVDRFRYYVAWYDRTGAVVDPQTPSARPYLMLDQGLSSQGKALVTPVAPDVEDLQLTYLYAPAVPGGAPRVVGGAAGVNASADIPLAMAVGTTVPPAMSDPAAAPARLTGHPANIQAVRISVVVRHGERDTAIPDTSVPAAANRRAYAGQPHYRRALWETTVVPRNLASTYFVFPI